jgi:ubiquinone/menaquinone biosynthesis C-methylase UbiE
MGKWFAAIYDGIMKPFEHFGINKIRKRILSNAHGKVLEIGSGTGANFSFYDSAFVEKVVAIEPNPFMIEKSRHKWKHKDIQIDWIEAYAEKLPFDDQTFDTIVVTLVLCSVDDPQQVIEELKRVCKHEGKILILEHVRTTDAKLAALQDFLTPAWRKLCAGCHLNRDTLLLLQQPGVEIKYIKHHLKEIFLEIEMTKKQ